MNTLYQQALSLYSQGDYEGAFDLLIGSEEHECILLEKDCKRLITDQYVYLIKEAIDCQDYEKARGLQKTYVSKYGSDTLINAFQIPKSSLFSDLGKEISSNEMRLTEDPSDKKPRIKSISLFIWGGLGITISLFVLYFIFGKAESDNFYFLFSTENERKINVNLESLKSNIQYTIITVDEKNRIAYCLDKDKRHFYIKYDLESGLVKEEELSTEDFSGIQYLNEAFYSKESNSIIFIGGNGWNGMGAGIYALRLDLSNNKLSKICFAREVKRVGDYLLAQQMELMAEGNSTAANVYNFYDEYYDYAGKLIDGKTVKGKGHIGKYAIEMSFHVLHKNVKGWYKYKGHTNYMTIEGKIDDTDSFDIMEFNNKMESFGRFTGKADFEKQTLVGTWENDNKQLDFYIGK